MRSQGDLRAWPLLAMLSVVLGAGARAQTFYVAGVPGSWPRILAAAGFIQGSGADATVCVVRSVDPGSLSYWISRAERGTFLVLEGDSALGRALDFSPQAERVSVTSIEEIQLPNLSVIWEKPIDLPVFSVPQSARVFVRERRTKSPLVAGLKRGSGGILWLATSPGERGCERFPHLLQALGDLGLTPPFRSKRFWAFFDPSYRLRVDLNYMARRWRRAGIAGLHVASWRFFEPDPVWDAYLRNLIEACHRQGILVYAWLELPHVSDAFWEKHPQWREKTALLQDAHLDWRKLMNLANRDCFRAVRAEVRNLLERYDWDGVNLAELYFESLLGHETPSRFTPMNDEIRREFSHQEGFDPLLLFDPSSPLHYSRNPAKLRKFLDFRIELLLRIQTEWLNVLEEERQRLPYLDVVITQVDDAFDPAMRDAIGVDGKRLIEQLARRDITFLLEDPATAWNLGPERYTKIARQYRDRTRVFERLAIDLNIVERYQDVYPTKQQTGVELLQLVNEAARAFPRVTLYFENSIATVDLPWLACSGAVVEEWKQIPGGVTITTPYGAGVPWNGPALVDGRLWPFMDEYGVWLPPGRHTVTRNTLPPPVRLLDFTASLTFATALEDGLKIAYASRSRAYAIVDRPPGLVQIDGKETEPVVVAADNKWILRLPEGQHVVVLETAMPEAREAISPSAQAQPPAVPVPLHPQL